MQQQPAGEEDYQDVPELQLEDEKEDAPEDQDEDEVDDKDATPRFVTPGSFRAKATKFIKFPRLTARKRIREAWRKDVEGQTEKEAAKIFEAMMFSPGPGQVSATKMKKIMDRLVEEKLQEALDARLKDEKQSEGVARRLFADDEKSKADEEEKQRYLERMEKIMEQDERLREQKTKDEDDKKPKPKNKVTAKSKASMEK